MNSMDRIGGGIDVASVPPITHQEWAVLAATEFDRVIDLLRQLTPDEWSSPTVCERWDVRAMVSHMVGMADCTARPREFMRVSRAAKKQGGSWIDAVTAIQVRERASQSPQQLVKHLVEVAPAAVRSRRRTPGLLRNAIRFPGDPPFEHERYSLGYVLDTLSTRDPWTHRLDISRATGRPMVLTADHDGRLIADAVADWARRHGQPFDLTLTGPAGGRWHAGSGGPRLELDALEFCWTLSGRAESQGLLAIPVPF
jgi:uncharacterized protein (TIGR03083 family)